MDLLQTRELLDVVDPAGLGVEAKVVQELEKVAQDHIERRGLVDLLLSNPSQFFAVVCQDGELHGPHVRVEQGDDAGLVAVVFFRFLVEGGVFGAGAVLAPFLVGRLLFFWARFF